MKDAHTQRHFDRSQRLATHAQALHIEGDPSAQRDIEERWQHHATADIVDRCRLVVHYEDVFTPAVPVRHRKDVEGLRHDAHAQYEDDDASSRPVAKRRSAGWKAKPQELFQDDQPNEPGLS